MSRFFLVDLDRCFGCYTCEVACKQEHNLPVGPRPIQVVELGPRRINGKVYRDFVPTLCCQCQEALCMEVCASEALERDSDGVIRLDATKCSRCELCVIACPYGVMGFYPDSSKPVKCDFCSSLVEKGLEPSCVSHCPANALQLRPESDVTDLLSLRHYQRIGQLVYVSQVWKLCTPGIQPKRGRARGKESKGSQA